MSKTLKIVLAIGAVAVLAIVGAVVLLGGDDAPSEVDLDTATAGVTTAPGSSPATNGAGTPGDLSGTWVVDTETGTFDYESATGSFVGFRVDEELTTIGQTTAVGRTGDVTGTVELSGSTVTSAEAEAQLTTLTTNDDLRNGAVQRALATGQFPTATFRLTEPIELGAAAAGGDVSTTANGELTVKGVTKPVVWNLQARLVDTTIVVVGSTEITLADFGVEVPRVPIVVSAEDTATVELQLLLVRA